MRDITWKELTKIKCHLLRRVLSTARRTYAYRPASTSCRFADAANVTSAAAAAAAAARYMSHLQ